MILQASEYEAISDIDLGEFYESTEGKFQTQTGKEWAQEICDRRKQQQSNSKVSLHSSWRVHLQFIV